MANGRSENDVFENVADKVQRYESWMYSCSSVASEVVYDGSLLGELGV